jgi:hypothetical protein
MLREHHRRAAVIGLTLGLALAGCGSPDFMTLMIPVIRWDQVALETEELAPVR